MHIDSATIIALGGREPQPDDSPEQRIATDLRNQRIYRELSNRCDTYWAMREQNRAKLEAYRQKKAQVNAMAKWRRHENRLAPYRILAWVTLAAGFYYIPMILGGNDFSSVQFFIWVGLWLSYGFYGATEFLGSNLWMILVLWVYPLYALGPLIYLYHTYFWSRAAKP